jgi:glycosyltransferase involved in cell wall biosynthesis
MNILYICNEYPPGRHGGIGSATKNLVEEMAGNGHKVFVAGLYHPGYGQPDYEKKDNIKIWRRRLSIDIGIIKNDYSLSDNFLLLGLKKTGVLRRSYQKSIEAFISFLQQLIIDNSIDIVEWPDYNECFEYGCRIQLPSDFPAPVIVKLHGSESYIKYQTNRRFDPSGYGTEHKHIHSAKTLVAVSRHTATQYESFYDVKKKITVLYNAVPVNMGSVQGDKDGKTIVFAGSLSPFKGLCSLLKAWNIVYEKYPEAILKIFGKGKPKNFIPLLDDHAKKSVVFMGFADASEIHQSFSNATAAVFPSYTECFSLTPLEAMSLGCPVIVSERASGPELIDQDVNGLLVDPDDINSIAAAIIGLLLDKCLRDSFSKRGRETIQNKFHIADAALAHLAVYQTTIQEYNRNKL